MFCYQCEQTAGGKGCAKIGVCGKEPQVAALQDLLVHGAKGLAQYATRARKYGVIGKEIDHIVTDVLFVTVTNVNFDADELATLAKKLGELKDKAQKLYEEAAQKAGDEVATLEGPAAWKPEATLEGLVKQGEEVGIMSRREKMGDDVAGLQELLTYGVKGTAAYLHHAIALGKDDETVHGYFMEALDFLTSEKGTVVDELVSQNLKCGEVNLKVMGLLDEANTEFYGHPEPTEVNVEPVKGKAILITGHDLKDLEDLLVQTEGKGVNVFTHGEMLPALAYPGLKKYKHLVGNYGGAWQDQQKEFEAFPGAILATTNCIQKPRDSYKDRFFTSGVAAWPGCLHIKDRNFAPLIEAAEKAEGFTEDGSGKKITIGFARNTVLSVAGKVIEAVKGGALKHFFLVGGCDGAKSGRNYYTELAEKIPQDCVILTLACGKFRFNKLEFGDIGGIPRLLDMGQCNDAYSAIQVAVALADAFDTDVNSLPLSMVLSWYEQKAVCILLTLLHLGIKDIRLGPSLPAFVTPTVLNVLVENFNIMPTTTADEDLKAILG